ncbi:MAG: LytTR family transcriptional regulator, partial [Solobacterium sp.]|nr:LytTR family transcriptional regulator [Solobacterium sp.]
VWENIDRMLIEIRQVREKMILIRNTDRGEELIPFHEILYAERSLRGMTVHLTTGRTVESVTLRSSFRNAVAELMKDSRFYLAGASMILNLEHIRGLKQECVLLRDETSVIVPKRCFSDLRRAWITHWQALDLTEDNED